MAIFGAAAGGGGIFANPVVVMACVFLATYVFVKFCSWAKGNKLSGSVKTMVFVLTGLGAVGFNIMYMLGNTNIKEFGDWSMATYSVLAALVWVFIFAYALMTQKAE